MNENRNILIGIFVIGIIILIILIAPTLSRSLVSYRGTALTASTTDILPDNYYGSRDYYYTIHRSVPRTTTNTGYSSNSGTTTTTYTYSSNPSYDYTYYPGNTNTYYTNDCAPGDRYSGVTGQRCY